MLDNASITNDPIKAKLTKLTGTKTPSDWGMTRCFSGSSNNIGITNPYVIDFFDLEITSTSIFHNQGFTVFSSKYFGHAIKFYINSGYGERIGCTVNGNGVVFKTDTSLGCPYDYKTAAFFENIYISIHQLTKKYGNSPTAEQFVTFIYDTLEDMYRNNYDYKDEYSNTGKPFDIEYGISGTKLFIYSKSNTDTTVCPYPLFFLDIAMKYKSNAYIDSLFASKSCYFSEDLYIIETGGEVIMSTSYEGKDCFDDDIVSRSDFKGHVSVGILSDFKSYEFLNDVCNMGYMSTYSVHDSYIDDEGYRITYIVVDENGYFINENVFKKEIPSTFISKEWDKHYSDRGYNAYVELYGLHTGQLKNTYYDYVYNWDMHYTSKDLTDSDLSIELKDYRCGNRSFYQYIGGILYNGEGKTSILAGSARHRYTYVPAPFPELHCEYDQAPIEFPSLEFDDDDEKPYVNKYFYWPIQAYKSYRNDDMVTPQKDYTSYCSRPGDTRHASAFHSYETIDGVKYHHFKITYTYYDAARGNKSYNVDYRIPYCKHKRKSKYEGEVIVTLQPNTYNIKCIAEKLKLTKWDSETNKSVIEYRDYSFSITTRASTWYPNPDTVENKYGFPYCVKYPTEKYIVTFSEDHKYIPGEEFEVSVPTQRAIKSISASLDKNQFYLVNHRLNISDNNIVDKSKSITTASYSIKAKKVNNVWTVQDKECTWSIVDRTYTTIGINYVTIKCRWVYYTDDDGNDYVEEPTCLVKVTIAQSIIGIMMWYEGPDIDLNETHYCKRSDIRVYLLYEHNAVKLIDAQGGPFRNPTIEILEDWPSDPYAEFDKSKLFINNDNRRDIYISKEGYNWIKGVFRYDDDIEFEEWFCVYAYRSKRIIDKSLKIIYIRSKTNWYYEDVTEQFEQYITRDGVTVIGWKNFLNVCNKFLLSGLFKIIAPARTGLNARYASEWMVFTPNETTLIATCKEIYNKDE